MNFSKTLSKYKWYVIGAVGIFGVIAISRAKKGGIMVPPPTMPTGMGEGISHHPEAVSRLGRRSIADPGMDDLDNVVNWVAAGPDPSAYSNLTLRNENRLYAHLPHPRLTGSSRNFERLPIQGSYGFVGNIGTGFTTYF